MYVCKQVVCKVYEYKYVYVYIFVYTQMCICACTCEVTLVQIYPCTYSNTCICTNIVCFWYGAYIHAETRIPRLHVTSISSRRRPKPQTCFGRCGSYQLCAGASADRSLPGHVQHPGCTSKPQLLRTVGPLEVCGIQGPQHFLKSSEGSAE